MRFQYQAVVTQGRQLSKSVVSLKRPCLCAAYLAGGEGGGEMVSAGQLGARCTAAILWHAAHPWAAAGHKPGLQHLFVPVINI